MHLANGTLANDVCTVTAALSAASILYAGHRVRTVVSRSTIAKVAIGSAIVALGQMIDVPLFGDVSAHMIGAAFLVVLAGPALALLGMTAVIVFQALVLHDGGITALGANVFNMAVVGVATAAISIHAVRGRVPGMAGLLPGALVAGAASVLAATCAMTAELVFSGAPIGSSVALTLPAHVPFAAWETVTTLGLVLLAAYARAIRPPASTATSN